VTYAGWGTALLILAALCLVLAFWKRPGRPAANWLLILLAIATFFIGAILLFFGIIAKEVR
jgi:hypothetical protein